MTLYRRIILFFAIILLITLFCAFFVININSTLSFRTIYSEYLHNPIFIGWFLGLYLSALFLTACAVKFLLRPLHAIHKQSEAILEHQFTFQNKIPQARELKVIVEAMNMMITKFHNKLDEEIRSTEQLHQIIYQDPVTGLGNRRYFESRRRILMSKKTKFGALLLIEFQGIKQYNNAHGYLKGNELIRNIGETIKENSQDIKEYFLARIGGSTFAIFTPDVSDEEVTHLATCLIHAIEARLDYQEETKMVTAHIGIAPLAGVKNAAQLLIYADTALKDAQSKGPFVFSQYKREGELPDKEPSRNAKEWKTYIEQIINDDLVTVVYQPILSVKDRSIMSYEALLRVKGENSNLTEARFIIPMADRYGLTYALDRCVINQVLAHVKATNTEIPYVINLSSCTLTHEPTLQWLFKILATGEYRNKLIFEFGEYTVLNNLSLLKSTFETLKQYGVAIGIEHLGHDFSGFAYLRSLKPQYFKIDGSYINDLSNQNTQFFVHFLTKIAHAMGILVIAECLELEAHWTLLQSFHLDGGQGEFLAPPEDSNTMT